MDQNRTRRPSFLGSRRTLVAVATVAGTLLVAGVKTLYAQPGCTSKYGYWDGSKTVCTTDAGVNCITCPK